LIDNEIEHSVEEFEDLHVVMFMQSLSDKSIYQGAIGVLEDRVENLERPWGADPLPPLTIKEVNEKAGFSFFPNPARDLITVVFAQHVDGVSVRMTDVTGKLIMTQRPLGAQQLILSVDDIPSGVYFLEVASPLGSEVRKLIIQH
jgi:hypothetical protein